MLISAMSRCEQGMTFLIMQDHQCAAPQNFSGAPDQPTWEERIGMDRFAVSINVENRKLVLSSLWLLLPQRSGPACEYFCQGSIGSNRSQLRENSLGRAVAVSPMPIGKPSQSLAGVATQIPGSLESDGLEEEEGE